MKKRSFGLFLVLLMTTCPGMFGQTKGLCINEVMSNDTSSVVDEYGKHQPWIEIFNSTFATINVHSCYLTVNKAVLNKNLSVPERTKMMYHIPKSDEHTLIGPRQFVLFWADGDKDNGTFHTDFTLDPTKANWVALYDANGYTLIDSITIPPMKANCSYSRLQDGIGILEGAKYWKVNAKATPCTNNITLDQDLKVTKFKEKDPNGFSMTITAMGVVFFALILLYLSFKVTGKIGAHYMQKNAMKVHGITEKQKAKEMSIGQESGDYYAAIAMALHEYQNNIHDVEETLLTIQRTKRNYSPWSSKIYSLRHNPKR